MMRLRNTYWAALAATAATSLLALSAAAQTPPAMTLDEVRRMVDASLPPIIQAGQEGVLIGLLRGAKMDTDRPLVKTFNPNAVARLLLGRGATRDPTCAQPLTAALDRDEGECTMTDGGNPQGGTPDAPGPFSSLTFSKNMQLGNITFFRRPAFMEITTDLPAVQLLPAVAYERALNFAENTLGMSPIEIPDARQLGAPLPVNTLALGFNTESAAAVSGPPPIELMRVVVVQRAFQLPAPIPDPSPNSEFKLTHMFAPGEATFLVNDAGVQGARVENWVSFPIDPNLDPRLAKSRSDLVDEIAQELFAHGGRSITKIQMSFGFGVGSNPNPDDPNSPQCAACSAVLRPVLRVVMYSHDAVDVQGVARPGLVQDFQLVSAGGQSSRLLR